jgi:hypothetical protein
VSETDISEFVAGNKNAFACNDKHLLPICNIVVMVLNIVMSYTCPLDGILDGWKN